MITDILFFILKHGFLLGIIGLFFHNLEISLTPLKALHLIISLIILEYYAYTIHKSFFAYQKKKTELRIRTEEETEIIENFLNDKLEYQKSEPLKELISKINTYDFLAKLKEKYKDQISEKLSQAQRILEKFNHKEEIEELEKKREDLNDTIKFLIRQEKELTQTEEERIGELREEMNLEENKIFQESELTDKKADLLIKEGYEQTNQYSVIEEENISVYIKPVMNHSKAHMFLVWEIKRILNFWYEADDIREHLTKDADITFKYNKKTYALEVETSSLLKKKEQAKEKVKYLNRKYKDRWMFVVSNRNDVSKYKKLGFVTERKQVTKNLDKLLKIDTPNNRVCG